MINLELAEALFQRATQIMGTRWLSATKVASPNPIREVMGAMRLEKNQKEDTHIGWSSGSRCWRPLSTRSRRRRCLSRSIDFAEPRGCERVGDAATGGA